ncbi:MULTISPECIES: Fe-S cluster assembly sulfur transfer protein SufU [unclassified Fusibacter]|uniref:Fe-S cluster assembly sulfur transfer protein SufU n=1 Tax=unclassified Fusibacter TaxID=2624464 RepID=UPI001013AC16|nr:MULTISPECIES: SUF system NifU family Fe-S cluster assembly protein [unclassified Fusibacter]MCK8060958.1 SUF system NifU family Fe-S cluster assembly protein [Fusibacter sp. A2]NPE23254.1 SUF system NifU family Fe-S cluster assembly protein [Fusibacter sp. A1]RXV59607.1 SUF system NifU family Fe-S cluster assembly protein [Fusibacter sp. A1]
MLDTIYTELILSHNQSGHNKGELVKPDFAQRGHNPNCGDDLTLMVNTRDGFVSEAKFVGLGCAISTASISIMIDLVKGKSVEEARLLATTYFRMIRGEEITRDDKKLLKDAGVFETLKDMPARVKCGTLGWHCLSVILDKIE